MQIRSNYLKTQENLENTGKMYLSIL